MLGIWSFCLVGYGFTKVTEKESNTLDAPCLLNSDLCCLAITLICTQLCSNFRLKNYLKCD